MNAPLGAAAIVAMITNRAALSCGNEAARESACACARACVQNAAFHSTESYIGCSVDGSLRLLTPINCTSSPSVANRAGARPGSVSIAPILPPRRVDRLAIVPVPRGVPDGPAAPAFAAASLNALRQHAQVAGQHRRSHNFKKRADQLRQPPK